MLRFEHLEAAVSESGLHAASVLVRRLDRAEPEAVFGDPARVIYPASMLKTPLSLAALSLVAAGELDLEGRYSVEPLNMTANDKPSPLVPGYESTLGEIIDLAITRSDNVATNMLYDIVGRERATEICQTAFGLKATAFYRKLSGDYPLINDPAWDGVGRNSHSAADAASLFELIARTKVPFAGLLEQTLARQEWNNKLSLGLQLGDRFAHKTGDTDEVTHDGGILHTAQGAAYVVVVYAAVDSTEENSNCFGLLMKSMRPLM